MKQFLFLFFTLLVGMMHINAASAQSQESIGGDTYLRGANSALLTNVPRDVFASGFSVSIDGDVSGDTHAAGFDVSIKGDIGADLYAAGSNISVESKVDEDISVSGFTVRLDDSASVGGNARLAGGAVTIDAPVAGSLVAAGGNVRLNATIQGDVRLIAANLSFGPDAKILGRLVYSTKNEMDIPQSVIAASQVEYKKLSGSGIASEMSERFEDSVSAFWPSVFSVLAFFIITLTFLLIMAAIFLSLMGERVEHLRQRAIRYPGTSTLFGFIGLATLFGLVPVSAMTIVGIPFIPIVILMIILMWVAGYLLGIYTISWRIAGAFKTLNETITTRLIVIAIGLVCIAILNFIPFAGALFNFLLVLLGLGTIMISIINCLMTMEIFSS